MARKRGKRWQADATIDGKRCRKSFATEAQADAWASIYPPVREVTTDQAMETLIGMAKALEIDLWGRGDNAIDAMRNVREAVGIIGDIAVRDFKSIHVQKLTAEYLKMGRGPATINRKYATLSKLCRRAVENEQLDRMPVFKRKKEPEGRNRFLTRAEETKLFDALLAIGRRDYDLAVFLVDTGARLGEAFSLAWADVDFSTGKITFTKTKTDLTRTIPMTIRVKAQMEAHRQSKAPFSDVNRWTARDHWNKAKKAAGFEFDPNVVPHILRHTCASRIVQDGHSLFLTQHWLGHRSPTMTNRYSHLAPNTLDRVVESLDKS